MFKESEIKHCSNKLCKFYFKFMLLVMLIPVSHKSLTILFPQMLMLTLLITQSVRRAYLQYTLKISVEYWCTCIWCGYSINKKVTLHSHIMHAGYDIICLPVTILKFPGLKSLQVTVACVGPHKYLLYNKVSSSHH